MEGIMEKIVIVDDDIEILELESLYLKQAGFNVKTFDNSKEAMEFLKDSSPDLLILDVMMPGMDGFSMVKELRKKYLYPIIFVSAKTQPEDTVKGLLSGGDDYIKKPFNPLEFTAKVKSILRTKERFENLAAAEQLFEKRNVKIDFKNEILTVEDKRTELTNTEWKLLKILYENRGHTISSESLFKEITGEDYYDKACNSIATHIRNLRTKLKDDSLIQTSWGKGYYFEEE